MQTKTSIEQLEELKAAAFLKTWQEQLMKLRDKDQRIAELEEEIKNLKDDCNRLLKERNEHLQQATDAIRELEKLQSILVNAPENIQNYFSKRIK